jgi:hypothetical protein
MKFRLIAALIGLVALVGIAGAACGGGGGDEEMTREEMEALLTEMAVTIDDLPAGLDLQEGEPFQDNEAAAETDPEGPTAALARFESQGRLLSYGAGYLTADPIGAFTSGGTGLIAISLTLYEDAEGATAGTEYFRGQAENPTPGAGILQQVTKVEGKPLSFTSVADESQAWEFEGILRPEDIQIDVDFTAHMVLFRRDKVVATVIVAAIGGATPGEEVEDVVNTLDGKIVAGLE